MKKVSIIIPVREINDYIREAILHHMELDYPDFEVLIFPDEPTNETFPYHNVKIIASGKIGPAEKRDLAMKYASGDIFAFTDDDAWPRADWLKNAVLELENSQVGAVGGPAVTAPNDSLMQFGSGKVYESFMCSGNYVYRYVPGKRRQDTDLPSVNLIVKREIFEQVHGFDSEFYPGEDTKLCLDIINTGKKIIYSPEVLVYHHRRTLFRAHWKQVINYARHRGYFVKKRQRTSMRITYFVPTFFTIGLVAGPFVCKLFPFLWRVYSSVLLVYFALASFSLRKCKGMKLFFLSLVGVFTSNISYGIGFVQGMCAKEMIR